MVQCRSSLGFSLEASRRLGVFGYFFGQKLQGGKSVEGNVLSLVDNTHPAHPILLEDAVVRDGLVDHERRRNSGAMLGVLRRRSQRGRHTDGSRKRQIPRFRAFASPCLPGGTKRIMGKEKQSGRRVGQPQRDSHFREVACVELADTIRPPR